MSDAGIMATNDDAAGSKRTAVGLGYWSDPFLKPFCTSIPKSKSRKSPLINRGYWARVAAVWELVTRALDAIGAPKGDEEGEGEVVDDALSSTAAAAAAVGSPSPRSHTHPPHPRTQAQVISLGAGFDTLFWRLGAAGYGSEHIKGYYEVDHPELMAHKREICGYSRVLELPQGDAERYHAIGADLRDSAAVHAALVSAGMDPTIPTILLTECVMVYLEGEHAKGLLSWAAETFNRALWINYERKSVILLCGSACVCVFVCLCLCVCVWLAGWLAGCLSVFQSVYEVWSPL